MSERTIAGFLRSFGASPAAAAEGRKPSQDAPAAPKHSDTFGTGPGGSRADVPGKLPGQNAFGFGEHGTREDDQAARPDKQVSSPDMNRFERAFERFDASALERATRNVGAYDFAGAHLGPGPGDVSNDNSRSISIGGDQITINSQGDPDAAAMMYGRVRAKRDADLLRNLQGAVR